MAFNSRASKKGAKTPKKEQEKQVRQQAQKREHEAEQPPQMEPALAAIVAADATLAGFVARWERTFLEILRMNDIDRTLTKKNGTTSDLFRQHREDDLADLDYVFDYLKETYKGIKIPIIGSHRGTKWIIDANRPISERSVANIWGAWILDICKYRRHMEQCG